MSQTPHDSNPYAPPAATLQGSSPWPEAAPVFPPADREAVIEAEVIRQQHLAFESALHGVAFVYRAHGMVRLAYAGVFLVMLFVVFREHLPRAERFAIGSMYSVFCMVSGALGLLSIWVSKGLRELRDGMKKPTRILAAFGLLGFPIMTLFSLYVLHLFSRETIDEVLASRYREVRNLTPHIEPATHWTVVLTVIFIVLAASVMFFALLQAW